MSPDLAYILGVSYGDGHVSNDRFVMSVVDKPFAQSVYETLGRLGFRPALSRLSVERLMRSKPQDCVIYPTKDQYRVSACSREFVRWHNQLTFDTIPGMLSSADLQVAFLRGFYESDGSVAQSSLTLHNTDRALLLMTQGLCRQLGFIFRLHVSRRLPSGKTAYTLSIHAQQAIGHFLALVQPCIKHSHR